MRRAFVFSILVLTSCGSSGADEPTSVADTGVPATDSASADTVALADTDAEADTTLVADATDAMVDAELYGPYPGGPYGNKVGEVLPNLSWRGFVNGASDAISSTKPFVETTLDTLRRTARKPYALIHVSEYF